MALPATLAKNSSRVGGRDTLLIPAPPQQPKQDGRARILKNWHIWPQVTGPLVVQRPPLEPTLH